MFSYSDENILDVNTEAIVNTVNCAGVMGKGLALQFKHRYPDNFQAYYKACKKGIVKPGKIFVFETGFYHNPKFIFNFPTKRHWKEASNLEDIKAGLQDLIFLIKKLNIRSIALPPLGCGNGKLDWNIVHNLIRNKLGSLSDINITIMAPSNHKEIESRILTKPKLTRARALLITLIGHYQEIQYRLSLIEVQKLAYFLQISGENLKLCFEKGIYGPFAPNLNKVLQLMEGHYITGYTSKPFAEIDLLDGALEDANKFLSSDESAMKRLQIVENLIDGFENPSGLELLGSVHWIAHNQKPSPKTEEDAIELIHSWNATKKRKFSKEHIEIVWNHLKEFGWL